ncbi:hypothetical protein [Nodosilinea sp. E11]|uniref:hypothetical protein n=1 Tax=Nodosilinea sp. E11 TaxID=3037479 RepID=UPI0029352F4B|nr:hypothetical protein [Nodosilinea sp. E11]
MQAPTNSGVDGSRVEADVDDLLNSSLLKELNGATVNVVTRWPSGAGLTPGKEPSQRSPALAVHPAQRLNCTDSPVAWADHPKESWELGMGSNIS